MLEKLRSPQDRAAHNHRREADRHARPSSAAMLTMSLVPAHHGRRLSAIDCLAKQHKIGLI